ncbi:MAG: hypothetical protein IV093_19190 [Rubrivivax sp.]|nr:hypothetical protein [Rubrivivax sp.]
MRSWVQRVLLSRPWVAFGLLVLSFLVFGALTVNLLFVLRANLALLAEHGWQAAMDGAAMQLLEIVLSGILGMLAYIVFKACEYRLVHWLTDKEH